MTRRRQAPWVVAATDQAQLLVAGSKGRYSQMGSTPGRDFMSRRFMIPLLTAAFLAAPAVSAFAGVNYNASKSNSGNIFTFDCKADLDGPKLCSNAGGTVKAGDGKTCTCFVPEKASSTSTPAKSN
jgi:hypothetical protein